MYAQNNEPGTLTVLLIIFSIVNAGVWRTVTSNKEYSVREEIYVGC
jgi:hypothetical protein